MIDSMTQLPIVDSTKRKALSGGQGNRLWHKKSLSNKWESYLSLFVRCFLK